MKKIRILLPVFLAFSLFFAACSKPEDKVQEKENKQGIESLGTYSKKLIDLPKMKGTAIFTDVPLERSVSMRGLSVDADKQAFYITQSNGTLPSDTMITKVESKDGAWQKTERMHAYESGYGYLSMENGKDGQRYMWIESNGTLMDVGTTISYVKWENDIMLQREYGQTFRFDELEGSLSAQVDEENDWLVIRVFDADKGAYYAFYDRSSLLSGEEPKCLYKVTCEAGQKIARGKDDSKGRYGNITYRGFAVGGGYIYQLHGNAQGRIYVAAFDLEGTLVYCHEVKELPDLTYREPNALCYTNGQMYLLITSGENEDRLASVMTF